MGELHPETFDALLKSFQDMEVSAIESAIFNASIRNTLYINPTIRLMGPRIQLTMKYPS